MSRSSDPPSSVPHSPLPTPHSLLDWLSTPAAYPERPGAVRRVETHISCVFLTDRFAYKLKKPVRFEFLDFSTLPLRRRACEEEVRLNRRLAPQVYLGLVAVRQDASGQFCLDEDLNEHGQPAAIVEWLVKMHRLPDDATLLAHLGRGAVAQPTIDAVASRLADFYRNAAPLEIREQQYRAELQRHIIANGEELSREEHGFDAAVVKRTHGAQLRFLHLRHRLLDKRVQTRKIVDGHGDLRPEHIYLLDSSDQTPDHQTLGTCHPTIIDCIEFNPEFRHLDWLDELCFLASECDFAGDEALSPQPSSNGRGSEVGRSICEQTLAALDDRPPPELAAFYRSYRACVRAKVAALRARQQSGESRTKSLAEAQRHLQWADRYARDLPPPMLLMMSGLMGSGKSTLAAKLAETLGAELIATDIIRREMFGASQQLSGYDEGNYRPEARQQVYDELFLRADRLLADGLAVILDGAFLENRFREMGLVIAQRHNVAVRLIHCHCPDEVARQRIAHRQKRGDSPSEARPDLFDRQRTAQESSLPDLPAIEVDTTLPLAEQIDCVLANS